MKRPPVCSQNSAVSFSPDLKALRIFSTTWTLLARGKAIVSTSLGAEGIDLRNGEDILIGDTPEEFAGHVAAVIQSPDLRRKLEVNGRKVAEQKYDWDILAANLDRSLHEIVAAYPKQGKQE